MNLHPQTTIYLSFSAGCIQVVFKSENTNLNRRLSTHNRRLSYIDVYNNNMIYIYLVNIVQKILLGIAIVFYSDPIKKSVLYSSI